MFAVTLFSGEKGLEKMRCTIHISHFHYHVHECNYPWMSGSTNMEMDASLSDINTGNASNIHNPNPAQPLVPYFNTLLLFPLGAAGEV